MTIVKHDDVVVVPADQEYDLTEEQEAFIEASIAEIERGEYVDGDEIIAELRRRAVFNARPPLTLALSPEGRGTGLRKYRATPAEARATQSPLPFGEG